MKQFIILASAILAVNSFAAATPNSTPSTSFESSLGAAWKTPAKHSLSASENNITMVYGGQDVSMRTSLTQDPTAA